MRRIIPWLAALFPAGLGLGLALGVAASGQPLPLVRLRIDIGTLALLTGLAISGLAMLALAWRDWLAHRHQRELRLALSQAGADRRRFLRRLDHELKNPLTAIRAGLANVADVPDPAPRREAMASVDAQVQRISRLTADLRKLSDLETRPLERAPVDLTDLLQQVVDLARDHPAAEMRRLTLTLPQAPWPLPVIPGDRDLILLAVHNLVDNAIKFTRPGDTIEVRAADEGAAVLVEVADTGPGIGDKDLPHVWEELYRGEGVGGVPGSGLGLALVQAIVERHNGNVALRSRAGRGTVFSVRLPTRD